MPISQVTRQAMLDAQFPVSAAQAAADDSVAAQAAASRDGMT